MLKKFNSTKKPINAFLDLCCWYSACRSIKENVLLFCAGEINRETYNLGVAMAVEDAITSIGRIAGKAQGLGSVLVKESLFI